MTRRPFDLAVPDDVTRAEILAEALDLHGVWLDRNEVLRGEDGHWRICGDDAAEWFRKQARR